MDLKTAIHETRKLYGGQRRGDAAARCALNEIEHFFLCPPTQDAKWWDDGMPTAPRLIMWQTHNHLELGNGPSRNNSKLSIMRQVYKTAGRRFPEQIVKPLARSKAPKWVLTEEQEKKVMAYLGPSDDIRDYIELVLETGLRVEEVLRLALPMLHEKGGRYSLEVPGTKTVGSYDLLPITDKAAKIIIKRSLTRDAFGLIFDCTYEHLKSCWDVCRAVLHLSDNPTATLKGLRRTFAFRHRHLPPAILQRLMRHSNLQTTSDYLNVTGMNEELRGYLDASPVALAGTPREEDQRVTAKVVDHVTIANAMREAGFAAIDVAKALATL